MEFKDIKGVIRSRKP